MPSGILSVLPYIRFRFSAISRVISTCCFDPVQRGGRHPNCKAGYRLPSNGIGIKSHVHAKVGGVIARFGVLVEHGFVGVGAIHQTFRGDSGKDGGQLGNFMDVRLTEEDRFLGVKPKGDPAAATS